jgi:hypothetical protein
MKLLTVVSLIFFCLTAVAPAHVTVPSARADQNKNTASLLTLNVCHAGGSALSVQADIPCVLDYPCSLSLFESKLVYVAATPVFNPLLLLSQQERPPKG